MERMLMEYCLNAAWLAPVVAGAAWLLVRLAELRPGGEYRVWLGALAVCVALPAAGVRPQRAQPIVPRATFPAAVEPLLEGAALKSAGLEADSSSALQPAGGAVEAASRSAWYRSSLREVAIAPRVARWLGWAYAGVVGFAALRLVRDWWAASRLVRQASPYAMTEAEHAVLGGLAHAFEVRVPRVLQSARVRSPVVLGAWRSLLLLPAGFEECSEAERRAALCHEFAHLRRRDCMVHAGGGRR